MAGTLVVRINEPEWCVTFAVTQDKVPQFDIVGTQVKFERSLRPVQEGFLAQPKLTVFVLSPNSTSPPRTAEEGAGSACC